MTLLPAAFLVRFRLPVLRFDRLPRSGTRLLDLPESARLAWPRALDAIGLPVDLRAGWNPEGLGFALTVTGRTTPILSDPEHPDRPDACELWIDTRETLTVHRATRYCHRLGLFPVGGGAAGGDAVARAYPVARAKEDAPLADADDFLIRSRVTSTGYQLEVWIPRETLHGYDPLAQPRLGFFACVHDRDHGRIPFSVGDEFPATADPSLWHTLELVTER